MMGNRPAMTLDIRSRPALAVIILRIGEEWRLDGGGLFSNSLDLGVVEPPGGMVLGRENINKNEWVNEQERIDRGKTTDLVTD